jgi:hypothetical protein
VPDKYDRHFSLPDFTLVVYDTATGAFSAKTRHQGKTYRVPCKVTDQDEVINAALQAQIASGIVDLDQ